MCVRACVSQSVCVCVGSDIYVCCEAVAVPNLGGFAFFYQRLSALKYATKLL